MEQKMYVCLNCGMKSLVSKETENTYMGNSSCKKLNQIIHIVLLVQGTYFLTQMSYCKNI